jgi:hypothetical protein
MPIEALAGVIGLVSALAGAGAIWGLTRGKVDSLVKDASRAEVRIDKLEDEKANHDDMVERLNKLDADKASKEQVDGNRRVLDERFEHMDRRFDTLEQLIANR